MLNPADQCGEQPVLTMHGHTNTIRTMAFLPCGQRIVTGSSDKTIRLWRVEDGCQEGMTMVHETEVWRLAVTNDGRRIVSNDHDGKISVWDVKTQKLIQEWNHKEKCPRVAISPNDHLVAYGSRIVVIREINGRRIKREIQTGKTLGSLSFSPDGNTLACGTSGDIYIYDVESGRRILELKGHNGTVNSLLWSHNGSRLYSGSNDQTIRCWNSKTGQQIGQPWTGHTGCVYSLSLSPDGTRLASGSSDKTVRLWDTASGYPIGHPLHHRRVVWAVSISPVDDFVASGGGSNKILLWRVPYDTKLTESISPTPSRTATPSLLADKHTFNPTHTHPPTYTLALSTLRIDKNDNSASHYPSNDRSPTISSVVDSPCDSQSQVKQEVTSPSIPHLPIDNDDADRYRGVIPSDTVESRSKHDTVTSQGEQSAVAGSPPSNVPANMGLITPPLTPTHSPSSAQDKSSLHLFQLPPDLTPHIIKPEKGYYEPGGFSDVHRCDYNGPSGVQKIAVKAFRFVFTIEEDGTRSAKMLRRELGIWKRLRHQNIVPFLGTASGFGMQNSLSLVSLWMPNGNLHKFLAAYNDKLDVVHRLQVLSDVASGLDYLHSFPDNSIVHGDLNGGNVLLDANFTARLTDFGYSSFLQSLPDALHYLERTTTRFGAIRWIAPEQLKDTYKRTPKSDIYSFGCISLQVLSGEKPWSEVREETGVILRLDRGENPKRPESKAIDDHHWEFIQKCWSSVEDRPTATMLVSSIQDLLDCCPQSPALRDMLPLSPL